MLTLYGSMDVEAAVLRALSYPTDANKAHIETARAMHRIMLSRRYFYRLVVGLFLISMVILPVSDSHTGGAQSTLTNGRIAFASNRDGDYEIYVMDADGSNVQQLTHNDTDDMWPTWSPDGSQIAFTALSPGFSDIYVMNADGSNPVNLTQGQTGYAPAWSPTGTKIAFVSGRGTGVDDIYVMDVDGSNPVNLTTTPTALDQLPSWSADGSQIIFRTTREWEPLNGIDPYYDAYIMKADGRNPHKLMPAGYELSAVSMSPNGARISFALDRDASRIYIAEADGSNPTILPPTGDIIGFDPRWSPEGDHIVFSVFTGSSREIAVMNPDGTNLRYLTNSGRGNIQPVWQPVLRPTLDTNITVTTTADENGTGAN